MDFAAAEGVLSPEDGADAEVKILHFPVRHPEDDADFPGVAGVDVREVGLFRENLVNPFLLFRFGDGDGFGREADHLLAAGVAEDLHPAVRQQFPAEVLPPGGEKVEGGGGGVQCEVDGADLPQLRGAGGVYRREGQDADILQFL